MYLFYCVIIIMIYNMIFSNVYFLVVQLSLFILFVLIRTFTNPDYCSPQMVWINEVLLNLCLFCVVV
jgi:hypothetical protein